MAREVIISLTDLLHKIRSTQDIDFLRDTAEWLCNALMEADVTEQIGAARYERTDERKTQRNGYRHRLLDTRLGTLNLFIPKLRSGSYYPDWLLERGRPAEQALVAVIIEAYVNGVSTRKMDRVVRELGLEHIDKSAVSRICKGLDERVKSFQERPLEACYPYVWLDATAVKVREGGRVVNMALVIAIGVRETGEREVLGFALGASEDEAFWHEFLRSLKARGLHGVKLVISDAHQGLQNAIQATFTGASWQRCRVHFMRNVLSQVPKSAQDDVANMVRTIFTQPTYDTAREQLNRVIAQLEERYPRAAVTVETAGEDILAYLHFPRSHWRRIQSTNPLERLNRELKRRFGVVGIFPNREAVIRLGGTVLLEQHEEWLAGRRYFSAESMQSLTKQEDEDGTRTISGSSIAAD